MNKSIKDLIISVFNSYKKGEAFNPHIEANIKTVERMLKLEEDTNLYKLNEKEVDNLINALVFARDMNGMEYEEDFDTSIIESLLDKFSNDN